MHELEEQAHALLSGPRQRRFQWLARNRDLLAIAVAEMGCLGIWDVPALDRQLQLTEEAISGLIEDPQLAVAINAEYAVRDATLIHARGLPPAGLDCSVCRTGRYDLGALLDRLPQSIE